MKNSGLLPGAFLGLFVIPIALGQTVDAVANAASFVPDEIAPGSIATIFGTNLSNGTAQASGVPLPTALAGTTVSVNGVAAPLYYVSPTQINFQVNSDVLAGLPTSQAYFSVSTSGSGNGNGPFFFIASASAPAIFVDANGRAIVQNQDFTLNSAANPAAVGSYITAYLTGIGAVDNPVPDGAATPASPLARATSPYSATIGGASANVLFLGLTPEDVGLAQANIQVPNLAPGTYPLVIAAGFAVSNAGLITVSGGTLSPQYVFTSIMGDGVGGTPATSSPAYAEGATVPYSYTPTSGFSTAVVEVDGTLSSASGSVAMGADHWLWAFGRPAAGTDFQGYITAPNDPVVIPYPQFYSNRPTSQTVRVTDPYCALESKVIAYPETLLSKTKQTPSGG